MTGDDYTAIYDPDTDFDRHYTDATAVRVSAKLGPGQRVLELGCATGRMTQALARDGREVVAVDRSPAYLTRAQARGLPATHFIQADLGALDLGDDPRFDHVIAANVLHELDDPVALLRTVRERHLANGGLVHVSLQNPDSIHRLAAAAGGLVGDASEVSDAGRRYATRRLYSADELVALGASAGLACVSREGVMLKPLPNDTMATLPEDLVSGFVAIADLFPSNCAMNLLTFRHA